MKVKVQFALFSYPYNGDRFCAPKLANSVNLTPEKSCFWVFPAWYTCLKQKTIHDVKTTEKKILYC